MTSQTALSPSRTPSELAVEVETLLQRYPNLSEQELATLIEAFPLLSAVEAALMTTDDKLSAKLDAFHREHGHRIRRPLAGLLAFIAFPALVAVGVLWWLFA